MGLHSIYCISHFVWQWTFFISTTLWMMVLLPIFTELSVPFWCVHTYIVYGVVWATKKMSWKCAILTWHPKRNIRQNLMYISPAHSFQGLGPLLACAYCLLLHTHITAAIQLNERSHQIRPSGSPLSSLLYASSAIQAFPVCEQFGNFNSIYTLFYK